MTYETGRLERVARLSVGPLALAGFFLPWSHGPGPLAATDFTGFGLVGYAGRLQALELTPSEFGILWAVRLLILGVAIAGVWQALLAPFASRHVLYRASGWYLVVLGTACAGIGVARQGVTFPREGLALLATAAAAFVVAELLSKRRPVPTHIERIELRSTATE